VVSVLRGTLTADFNVFGVRQDDAAGTIGVILGRTDGPVTGRGSGSVLQITFRIRNDAPRGGAVINLRSSSGAVTTQLNDGGLVLNPEPSDESGDALDGLVTVLGPRRAPPVRPGIRSWIDWLAAAQADDDNSGPGRGRGTRSR
jgi:hypothetical protein